MKKIGILLTVALSFSLFSSVTASANSETSGVIDLSHENPTSWGFTLGTKDEIKRWQTFTSPVDGSMQEIGLFLREKVAEGDLSPLIVELYATANGKPTGSPLQTVSLPPEQVVYGTEMKVTLTHDALKAGTQYAVSLTQETLSDNGGLHNYSWPTKEVNPAEKFGKYSAGAWVDESFLGDGWLRVYYSYERSPSVATSVAVSPKYLNLSPNETANIQASVFDQYGSVMDGVQVSWASSDVTVAEVVYGEVKAVGIGTAAVTATVGSLSAETIVTVSDSDGIAPVPGMIITEDTVLKPGIYDFSSGAGLIIGADDITLDGSGAVLVGPGSLASGPNSYKGTAVTSDGHSGFTVKGLSAKGFNNGLHAKNGSRLTITGNNFSDNYTNPDHGWGDGEMYSAVLLESVQDSTIDNNRGNHVWNGLHLRHSDRNTVENNDFSHTSNVSLKMWHASENIISDNDFSYGIRIAPGEVHARDSTSMLMESGSNNNKLYRNDFQHGGDGIFIRVLNGWVSTGNYFEENDTSYANNNAIESWSPGNTYVRNIANYSSYGFWLGGSDDTVLIGNTVKYNGGYNGIGRNNAPEAFGNAGIAVVNGPSSHFVMKDNDIQFNNGPGVAIRYKADYPAFHWIIQNNTIQNNKNDPRGYKGYGIYVKDAKWLDIAGNDIKDNDADAIKIDSGVSDLFLREASMTDAEPIARMTVSSGTVSVGQEVTFDASGSSDPQGQTLNYRWDLGDGTVEGDAVVKHVFEKPGFYRVGVTVNNGKLADLASADVYVLDALPETGTDADSAAWDLMTTSPGTTLTSDSAHKLQGNHSIHVSASGGNLHSLIYPKSKDLNADLSGKDTVSFWIKYHAEHGSDLSNRKPVVRLYQDEQNYFEFTPSVAYLEQLHAPISEQRDGWKGLQFSLTGNDPVWSRTVTGTPSLQQIQYMGIMEGPGSGGLSEFWIDGLQLSKANTVRDISVNVARNNGDGEYPKPIGTQVDPTNSLSSALAPLKGNVVFNGSNTPRWIPSLSAGEIWYGVEFAEARVIDRADVYFYHNPSGTPSQDTEWKPDAYRIEYWDGDAWKEVKDAISASVTANRNSVSFKATETTKLRVVLTPHVSAIGLLAPSIYSFAAYHSANAAGNAFGENEPAVTVTSSSSQPVTLEKVGLWINRKGTDLSDPIVEIYETENGKPVGSLLTSVTFSKDAVQSGAETLVEVNLENVKPGETYAVALTQTKIAPNGLGDHWRWPTRNIGKQEKFGKYVRGNWIDESFLGTGWLKLYTDRGLIDYSHPTPSGGGFGVGHADEEKRWQTFTVPADQVWETIDGSVQDGNGWISTESDNEAWIEVNFLTSQVFNTINVYLNENETEGIALPDQLHLQYWNGSTWADVEQIGTKEAIKDGFNAIRIQSVTTDRFRLSVIPQSGAKVEIREIELFQYHGHPLD